MRRLLSPQPRPRSRRRTRSGVGLVAGLALVATALTGSAATSAAAATDDFYTPPGTVTGAPGTVLKAEPTTFYLDPLRLLRAPARAQRLMYVSSDVDGDPTAVTGTLLRSKKRWWGPGRRPLVSFAVGTQGMADRCAPSRQLAAGTEYEGLFIKGFLARGYDVVVSDYEGLGTPGTHRYVNTIALGRNVLDAARAAKRVPTDAVPGRARVYLAGYSEGGNAVGGALQEQPTYAPELRLRAGYAGAVPAELARVADQLDGSPYAAFLLYSIAALDAEYPELGIRDLLNARGKSTVDAAEDTCTDGALAFAGTRSATLTKSGEPITAFLDRPDIAAVLEELRVGRVAPEVPVFMAHTTLDDVVPYAQGRDAARSWCRQGARVRFSSGVAPTHVGGAVESYPKALAWLEARIAGFPVPSSCRLF